MAPEQLAGRDADARSDIFAFGAVLYEMATGQKAFPGTTQATVIGAILHTDPAPVSPPSLDRAIRVCLAKDADERWQSVRDLKRELEWIAEAPAAAPAPGPAAPSRLPWIAAGVAVLAALLLAVLSFRQPAAMPRPTKFVVPPPDNATFGDSVVVSPNGRLIVFTALSEGRTTLWVRPLDSLAVQQLPGTGEAIFPFWSPDSRFVAFFAGGKLKKGRGLGRPSADTVRCAARHGRRLEPGGDDCLRWGAPGGAPARLLGWRRAGEPHCFRRLPARELSPLAFVPARRPPLPLLRPQQRRREQRDLRRLARR